MHALIRNGCGAPPWQKRRRRRRNLRVAGFAEGQAFAMRHCPMQGLERHTLQHARRCVQRAGKDGGEPGKKKAERPHAPRAPSMCKGNRNAKKEKKLKHPHLARPRVLLVLHPRLESVHDARVAHRHRAQTLHQPSQTERRTAPATCKFRRWQAGRSHSGRWLG